MLLEFLRPGLRQAQDRPFEGLRMNKPWEHMSHAPPGVYGTLCGIWDIFYHKTAMSGHLCASVFICG
jgi:hypothetical protein